MANISQGSTENVVLGEGYSPWALNSNDLYPDSTSYIVGIGNSNPDTALHITAADGADFLKLDDGTNSSTLSLVDSGQDLVFKSDAYWSSFSTKIRNTSETVNPGNTFLHLQAYGGLIALYFDDWTETTETSQGVGALAFSIEDERAFMYGDDGFAGGMFTMDWVQAFDTRFGFGYGDEALSNDARLAIKHTSSPQLFLDDGTNYATFTSSSQELALYHDSTNWAFSLDATSNTNIDFKQGGVLKAELRHNALLEAGLLHLNAGMFKFGNVDATATTQTPTASNNGVNVYCLDGNTNSAAQTFTLPAIANYAGVFFKLIDAVGAAETYSITVQPQSGEKLNGVTDGTFVLDQNYQTATVWGSTSGWYIESNTKIDECLRIEHASNPQLKLDDGTSSTTFQHDDNAGAPVLRLDSSTLEIEDSVSGGGTQLVLKNGAGDTSTFSQNSTDNGLDIVTTDYHVRLYSTHSSGMASLCDGSGVPKIQWFNSQRACYISGGQQRDAISVSTTAGAYSAGSGNACFLYMCDTSAADVATAGALTFNLPADSTMTGRYFIIKDTGGLAGTYNINITPNGTDKMDNVASDVVSIATNYGSVTIYERGGWWTIA